MSAYSIRFGQTTAQLSKRNWLPMTSTTPEAAREEAQTLKDSRPDRHVAQIHPSTFTPDHYDIIPPPYDP